MLSNQLRRARINTCYRCLVMRLVGTLQRVNCAVLEMTQPGRKSQRGRPRNPESDHNIKSKLCNIMWKELQSTTLDIVYTGHICQFYVNENLP